MKIIANLNDQEILGLEGLSTRPPRYTARAIVRNEDGKYAVMYSEKFNLYSLPGGGIEEGEDPVTALRREVLEETVCSCEEIRELGIVTENRGTLDYTQINYYYFVRAGREGENHLTDSELASATSVRWFPFDEMNERIRNQNFERAQGKYLQARDMKMIEYYEECCQLEVANQKTRDYLLT